MRLRKGEFNGLRIYTCARLCTIMCDCAFSFHKVNAIKNHFRTGFYKTCHNCLFIYFQIYTYIHIWYILFWNMIKCIFSFFAPWFCYTGYWPFGLVLRSITSPELSCINSSFGEKRPLLPLGISKNNFLHSLSPSLSLWLNKELNINVRSILFLKWSGNAWKLNIDISIFLNVIQGK